MKVVVAGGTGLVGSAIVRGFQANGHEVVSASTVNVNFLNRSDTIDFLNDASPDIVVDAAARVGGIGANDTFPVEFLMNNINIQNNLMEAAHLANVNKFIFLGSSCIYPRDCAQPIKEDYLLTGHLEKTNSAYAIAKIAGVELVKSYRKEYGHKWISLMPTNLYGPNDNFFDENSHLISAALKKCHEAKLNGSYTVEIWGSGKPRREFTFVTDVAEWIGEKLARLKEFPERLNIGAGKDNSVKELYEFAAEAVGYEGKFEFNTSMPDGIFSKLMDSSMASSKFGWSPTTSVAKGMELTYKWWKGAL